jgi:hypothetical protein
MTFKDFYTENTLFNRSQGTHSKIEDMGNGKVKKTPLSGNTFSETEYSKILFMQKHSTYNVFADVYEITPTFAVIKKLDTSIQKPIWLYIKNNIVIDHERSTVGKYGGESRHDRDAMSQFIMNDILSPNALEYYITWFKDLNTPISNMLSDYMIRVKRVTNWPVTKFDIHIENIGRDPQDNKIKIFDF